MNYKKLFQRVFTLLSAPGKAWDDIKAENAGGKQVLVEFAYPLIGLCGLAEFVGVMFKGGDSVSLLFQQAMTCCCAVAVSLFGGLFISASLLDWLNRKWVKSNISYDRMLAFAGYSMVVVFVLSFFRGLSNEFVILCLLLQLYTAVVAYEGTRRWLSMKEERQTHFVVMATVILLVCPAVIEILFNKLSEYLN